MLLTARSSGIFQAAPPKLDEFVRGLFQETLAQFLEQASAEPMDRFLAQAKKAGKDIIETRNTADLDLITQMLMPLLKAVGSAANVPILRKRIRNNVVIHNAEKP